MLFCWDPDSEMPFDVFTLDDLPCEVQSWMSRDIVDLRLNKFIVQGMGIEKDFSLFMKIQSGTSKAKMVAERDRLVDMYFRSLDAGQTMSKAYRQIMMMTASTLMSEETPKRRTRNSQVLINFFDISELFFEPEILINNIF